MTTKNGKAFFPYGVMGVMLKTGRDTKGNKTLLVSPFKGRGFSIQTNGNLPATHSNGVGMWSLMEVSAYVAEHGTERQRAILETSARNWQA